MVELIIATYGGLCYLVFARFKLVPVTTYTVATAILGGIGILMFLFIGLTVCHPVSHDGRLYTSVTNIVPAVRGTVIEVPIKSEQRVQKGDVLFKIDPRPFQYAVDRLQAQLAAKNTKLAQLKEQLVAAEASRRAAEANLLVAESTFDRQARESAEQAASALAQAQKRLDYARSQVRRYAELVASRAVSQQEYERIVTQKNTAEEEVQQAANAERIAREKLSTGGASLQAVQESIKTAKAEEQRLRLEVEAESNGVNPDVRQTMAELDQARWELEQTMVRAPYDGYVPQVILRPGQMAVPLPLTPLMVFVESKKPVLLATFHQTAVAGFEPGLHAEVSFKTHPGHVYKAKVVAVASAIREGQLDPSGKLLSGTPATAPGYVPVLFEYDDEIENLHIPIGSQASIAVYTHRLHALSLVRMIILRMKSWENYLFGFELPTGH